MPRNFDLKMLSAHYGCCLNSNALQNILTMEAITMNLDQTPPLAKFKYTTECFYHGSKHYVP